MAVPARDSGNTNNDTSPASSMNVPAPMDIDQDASDNPAATVPPKSTPSKSALTLPENVEKSSSTHQPSPNPNQEPGILVTPTTTNQGHPSTAQLEQEQLKSNLNKKPASCLMNWSPTRDTDEWWCLDNGAFVETDNPDEKVHWECFTLDPIEKRKKNLQEYLWGVKEKRRNEDEKVTKKLQLNKMKRRRLHVYHMNHRKNFCELMNGGLIESSDDEVQPRRPSDIVKGHYKDEDFDFPKEERKWSRRRRTATALKITLIRRNMVHPCSNFELERYGLKSYGERLKAPPKDRNISKEQPYYYNLYHHQKRGTRRRRRTETCDISSDAGTITDATSESQATCGGLYEDRDFFELTDKEADYGVEVRKSTPFMSKHYFGDGIVPDNDVPAPKRITIMSAGTLLRCKNHKAKPKKPPHVLNPHFNRLVNTIASCPGSLFSDIEDKKQEKMDSKVKDQTENLKKNATKEGGDAEEKGSSCDEWWSSDEEQTMPVFDWMKRDSYENFYTPRKEPNKKSKKKKRKGIIPEQNNRLEEILFNKTPPLSKNQPTSGMNFTSKFSMKYFKKHKFQGGLGKNNQGISEIIWATNISTGGGIGSKALHDQNNETSIAASISRVKPVNFKTLKTASERKRNKPKKRARSPIPTARRRSDVHVNDDDKIIYLDVEPASILPPDNRRRAVLLDLDTCFVNSHSRRVSAFRAFIEMCPEFPRNAETVLFTPHGDLSDFCAVKALMQKHNLETNEESIQKLLDVLDSAFKSCEPLKLDKLFLKYVRKWTKFARIGVLHVGTQNRMLEDLKVSGLGDVVTSSARVTVDCSDIAPYVVSWRELVLRMGVSASQSVFFVPDRNLNLICSGVIAARALASRSFVKLNTSNVDARYLGDGNPFGSECAMFTRLMRESTLDLKRFLQSQRSRTELPVLAKLECDQLWHSGVAFFPENPKANSELCDIFVRFDVEGELRWIHPKSVRPLAFSDYLLLKDNDYPALLDPSDVKELQYTKKPKVAPCTA